MEYVASGEYFDIVMTQQIYAKQEEVTKKLKRCLSS